MKITLEVKIPQELLEADPNFADRVQEQLKYTGTQMVLEKIAWFKNRNFIGAVGFDKVRNRN